jgi:hypothetical protein
MHRGNGQSSAEPSHDVRDVEGEPSGAPDPAKVDLAKVKGIPHLIVWGDYIDQVPVWGRLVQTPNKYFDALRAAGGTVEVMDLPAMGIRGNSHMLMMDRNSDEIAKLVQDWLDKQNLAAQ